MAAENRKIYAFPGKFKSQVWNCFGFYMDDKGKLDRSRAICRMCFRAIAYSGNTTNLHNHVSHHHPQAYGPLATRVRMAPMAKFYNLSPETSNSGDGDGTVKSDTDKILSTSTVSQCSYTVQSALLDFIVNDLEPVQTLDSPTFRNLLKACGLRHDVPPSEYFTNFMLDCYGETRQKVLQIVSHAKSAYLKLHIWKTNTTDTNLLTVSAQVLYSESKLDSFVLQTVELPEDIDSNWISGYVSGSILSEWNIPENSAILTTDLEELRQATKELNCVSIVCLADSINKAAEGCLRKPVIAELLNHARKLIRQFVDNSSNMSLLQEKQTLLNLPNTKLKLDAKSSWISSYEMLENVQAQAAAIYSVLKDPLFISDDNDVRLLNSNEQTLLQSLLTIMKSLVLANSMLSEMSHLSAAVILPVLKKLETTLIVCDVDSRVVADVKSYLWTTLSEKYSSEDTHDFLLLCSAVDPRYKDMKFVEPEDRERVITLLKDEMAKLMPEKNGTENPTSSSSDTCTTPVVVTERIIKIEPLDDTEFKSEQTSDQSPSPAKKPKPSTSEATSPSYADSSWLDDVVHDEIPAELASDTGTLELTRYENEKQILSYSSPLVWWNERKFIYPLLSQVAMKYLGVPAVLKVSDPRQELIERKLQGIAPEMIEYMVFLNANYFKSRGPS